MLLRAHRMPHVAPSVDELLTFVRTTRERSVHLDAVVASPTALNAVYVMRRRSLRLQDWSMR